MVLMDQRQIVFALDTLAVGKKVYNDRDYRFTEVSAELGGATDFVFANGMTPQTVPSYVQFRLFRPATLYVRSMQATSLPGGWMKAGCRAKKRSPQTTSP